MLLVLVLTMPWAVLYFLEIEFPHRYNNIGFSQSISTDGTLVIIALVINSIGLYNVLKTYSEKSNKGFSLLWVSFGLLLSFISTTVLIFIKDGQFSENINYKSFKLIQIVTLVVTIIWFVANEFIIENEKNKL